LSIVSQELDPVVVRIKDERNVLHPALLRPLLELDTHLVESFARRFEVVYGNADVAETASWLFVTIRVALEARVGFCL
jgi:hypothetical protein